MSCAADKDKGMNILLLLTLNNTLIIRTRGKDWFTILELQAVCFTRLRS